MVELSLAPKEINGKTYWIIVSHSDKVEKGDIKNGKPDR
jgi:hypothetical protein